MYVCAPLWLEKKWENRTYEQLTKLENNKYFLITPRTSCMYIHTYLRLPYNVLIKQKVIQVYVEEKVTSLQYEYNGINLKR